MNPFIYILFCTFLVSSISFSLRADEIHSLGILLDVSKSVSPKEFESIKDKIRDITAQQNPSLHFSLYIFGNNLQKISMDQLLSIGATQSNTIFYDALYDVLQELEKQKSDKKSILIFSDGIDTRSATVLNDIVSYAREQEIVIHCVGMGKANRRLLERLAKLTGGKYFEADRDALIEEIRSTIHVQSQPDVAHVPPAKESVAQPVVAPPAVPETSTTPASPAEDEGVTYRWVAAISGVILVGALLIVRLRKQKRTCPTCGKFLESSQLVCSDCPGQTEIRPRPEIPALPPEPMPAIAQPVLQSSHETQELLSKTYFLDQTPELVVTKGPNTGEKYRLSKDHPVSIGRSRLNEIRPDDPSISAQHCRIIPENGEYVIYDLGSTNGTVVNNIHVNMAVLEEGDTIRIGATNLVFTLSGS